jgi:hypothetical protein
MGTYKGKRCFLFEQKVFYTAYLLHIMTYMVYFGTKKVIYDVLYIKKTIIYAIFVLKIEISVNRLYFCN